MKIKVQSLAKKFRRFTIITSIIGVSAAGIILLIFDWDWPLFIGTILIALSLNIMFCIVSKKLIVNPLDQFLLAVENISLNEQPNIAPSNIEEIKKLRRSVKKLWIDAHLIPFNLSQIIQLFAIGIFFYKINSDNVFCSQTLFNICGYDIKEGYIDKKQFDNIYHKLTKLFYNLNYSAYLLDDFRWIRVQTKTYKNYHLGIITDVTNEINGIKKIEVERDIDSLTGLYNRDAFIRYSQNIFADSSIKIIAVIMWDIDKLKYINDTYGHDVGDHYICKFAEAIKILEEYGGLVSRRSGDEFLGLIYGETENQLIQIINELTNKIEETSILIGEYIVEKMRVSSGIAWYPEDGDNLLTLLNYADFALYEAKYNLNIDKNKIRFDSSSLINHNMEFTKIIENSLITFAYQPIMNAKTSEVFAYEALMRIYSEVINKPEKLISIAKVQSKLHLVEEMVFHKCIESYHNYHKNMASNVFINSLPNIILCDISIRELFSDLNDFNVIIEIIDYENSDKEIVKNKLKLFQDLKIDICIDNYLPDYNNDSILDLVNYIKLDISFVHNINNNIKNQNAMKEIIVLAKAKGIKIIAKGVNSYEEMKYLTEIGVDFLQGYYIAMPSPRPSKIADEVVKKHQAIINQKSYSPSLKKVRS